MVIAVAEAGEQSGPACRCITLLLVSAIVFSFWKSCQAMSPPACSAGTPRRNHSKFSATRLGLDPAGLQRAISRGLATSWRRSRAIAGQQPSGDRHPGHAHLQYHAAVALRLPGVPAPDSSPASVQAIRRDRPTDHVLSVLTLVLLSMPDFLLATICCSPSWCSYRCCRRCRWSIRAPARGTISGR